MQEKMERKFIHTTKAWYSENLKQRSKFEEEIMIGMYSNEGGTTGEFSIRWYSLGDKTGLTPKLECFNDAWGVLYNDFHDILEFLGTMDRINITPEEFIEHLTSLNISDATVYDYPYYNSNENKSSAHFLTMKVYGLVDSEYFLKAWDYEPNDAEIEDAIYFEKNKPLSPIPEEIVLDFESIRNDEGRVGPDNIWFRLRKINKSA